MLHIFHCLSLVAGWCNDLSIQLWNWYHTGTPELTNKQATNGLSLASFRHCAKRICKGPDFSKTSNAVLPCVGNNGHILKPLQPTHWLISQNTGMFGDMNQLLSFKRRLVKGADRLVNCEPYDRFTFKNFWRGDRSSNWVYLKRSWVNDRIMIHQPEV